MTVVKKAKNKKKKKDREIYSYEYTIKLLPTSFDHQTHYIVIVL